MVRKKQSKQKLAELRLCAAELSALKDELGCAYSRFDGTADPDTLDACVFEIGALRSRYNSAIKHYKERYYSD